MHSSKIMFIVVCQSSFYSFFPLDRYSNIKNKFEGVGSIKGTIDYKNFHKKENFLFDIQHDTFRYYSNQLDAVLKVLKTTNEENNKNK